MLARTPGVTAVALLALALGIGANTAIFSVVHAVLLRPLPLRDPSRLVAIHSYNPQFNIPPIAPGYDVYASWRGKAGLLESMAASWSGTANLSRGGENQSILLWKVSASFWPVMGVTPVLGRSFRVEEDRPGSGRVILLSYGFWQRRFSADAGVLGTNVLLDGNPHTIIGILPSGFSVDGKPPDVYAPFALPDKPDDWLPTSVYGRLQPGVTVQQANAEMDSLAQRAQRRPPGWRARVMGLRESMVQDARLSLIVLLGAVGLVLLLACANVASILLAKAGAREREMAVRTALGARRSRLMRQLLTENTMLALAGGGVGVLIASWCVRLVPLLQDERLPTLLAQTRVDGPVLAFTLALSVITGLVFGAAPAFSGSRSSLREALQEGGRAGDSLRRRRTWNLLVISETALALVLMAGATLLIRSFFYLRDIAPGFRVDGLLTASLAPDPARYSKPGRISSLYDRVLERVRAIPGVQSATLASTLPLGGEYQSMSMPVEGQHFTRPQDFPIMWHRSIDPDYFRTMQIPIRMGRAFTERDRGGAPPVVIINEVMARRFWPGQSALGKHLGGGRAQFEIVGVAADVRHQNATDRPLIEVFFSRAQVTPNAAMLAIRPDPNVYPNPLALTALVERAAAAVDHNQKLTRIREMQQIASDRLAPKRLTAQVIAAFAGLALVLAAVGIYGVLSFAVSQRTHEIGVRMALGARRKTVLRMVVGNALRLAGIGVFIGTAASLVLSRLIRSMLFGVKATDPAVFVAVAAALLGVAAMAAFIPACRAATVDSSVALRHE